MKVIRVYKGVSSKYKKTIKLKGLFPNAFVTTSKDEAIRYAKEDAKYPVGGFGMIDIKSSPMILIMDIPESWFIKKYESLLGTPGAEEMIIGKKVPASMIRMQILQISGKKL